MDLPPGVVLASPDDPSLAGLPTPSVPTPPTDTAHMEAHPQPEALPPVDPTTFSPEIQQILGHTPPASQTAPAPMHDLPELPLELFGSGSATPATASPPVMPAPEQSTMGLPMPELATETPGLWSTAPEPNSTWEAAPPAQPAAMPQPDLTSPLADPFAVAPLEPPMAETPSLIPDAGTTGPILSELFLDSVMTPPQASGHDPMASAPVTPAAAAPVEPAPIQEPGVDLFYTAPPEQFLPNALPPDMLSMDPDPLPPLHTDMHSGLEAPSLDATGNEMDTLAAFMPPPDPQVAPADSLTLEPAADAHADADIAPSLPAASFEPDVPIMAMDSTSENDGFFASVSFNDFDAMGGFGQVNAGSPFVDEKTAEPLESYYLPADDIAMDDLDGGTYSPSEAYSDAYSMEHAAPLDDFCEPIAPQAAMPADHSNAMDSMPGHGFSDDEDSDGVINFDEELQVSDGELESYDLGHYDDPDEPAAAFVLDEEPLESMSAMTSAPQSQEADFSQSAFYYTQEESPEELPIEEHPEPLPSMAAALPEKPIEASRPVPAPPKPTSQPGALPASMTKLPSAPIPPKLPTRHYYYSDSIAEALDSFEQEVLLRDSQFLKQSINNLVERYFAQSEPENDW